MEKFLHGARIRLISKEKNYRIVESKKSCETNFHALSSRKNLWILILLIMLDNIKEAFKICEILCSIS